MDLGMPLPILSLRGRSGEGGVSMWRRDVGGDLCLAHPQCCWGRDSTVVDNWSSLGCNTPATSGGPREERRRAAMLLSLSVGERRGFGGGGWGIALRGPCL